MLTFRLQSALALKSALIRRLSFVMKDNHIEEIVTNKGTVKPGLVICAAGIYSRKIGEMVGMDAHVKPERGFCLVSEKMPKILNNVIVGARQTVSGNIIFGFIADKVPMDCVDRRMYIRCLQWAAKDAVRDFPALQNINIIRSYTGMRCKPEDKFPLLDQRTRSTTSGSTLHTVPLHTILCFRTTLQRWSQASVRMILCRNTFILVLTSNRKEIKNRNEGIRKIS